MTKQKEDFAAQLRGLRLLLGRDNKPVSGETFSEMSGVALGTIRAIENGSRKLSEEDRQKIAHHLRAHWSSQKKRWVDARDGKTLYSRQLYEAHAQALNAKTTSELRKGTLIFTTLPALFYLLMKLPDRSYRLAILKIHDCLQAIAETSDAPPEVFEVLKLCAPAVKTADELSGPIPHPEEPFSYMYSTYPKDFLRLKKPDLLDNMTWEIVK